MSDVAVVSLNDFLLARIADDEGWAQSHCDGCSAAESADRDRDRVLRHLAAVYADHPDYRQEWKP